MQSPRRSLRISLTIAVAVLLTGTFLTIPTFPGAHAEETPGAGQWSLMPSGTPLYLYDVDGAGSRTYAVGASGLFLSCDGFDWNLLQTPTVLPLRGIWTLADDDAYLVGASGNIFRFDGRETQRMTSSTSANLYGVWGRATDDIYAVGDYGTIMHYDGSRWSRENSRSASRLLDVEGGPDGTVYAVGEAGTIRRFDGREWRIEDTPAATALNAIWVSPEGRAFAVGDAGVVLIREEDEWRLQSTPTTMNLNGVWGLSANRVFASGAAGVMVYFDGSSWSLVDTPTTMPLARMNDGFVVGASGIVLRAAGIDDRVEQLRITELMPWSGQVEVTNFGSAFVSDPHSFCQRNDCSSGIPAGTDFASGGIALFEVSGLASGISREDSDLWLYRSPPFSDGGNIVHGVKYGPIPGVGNTRAAVAVGKWPALDAFAPSPTGNISLAYDGHGMDPKDWYLDETPTLGAPDFTRPGTVANALAPPEGLQDFENISLGDEVFAIEGWRVFAPGGNPGAFTARAVNDVRGDVSPRGSSTRWLRIRDQVGRPGAENAMATATLRLAEPADYRWSFWVNLEELPPVGGGALRLAVQHEDALHGGFVTTWGFAIRARGLDLFVTPPGGEPATRPLLSYREEEILGRWLQFSIAVDVDEGFVEASAGDSPPLRLPIAPAAILDPASLRLACLGGGPGATGTLLLDDVGITTDAGGEPFFTALRAEATDGEVLVSWAIRAGAAVESFAIHRREAGSNAESVIATGLSPTRRGFVDFDPGGGEANYYFVVARRSGGSLVRSAAAMATLPPPDAEIFRWFVLSTSEQDVTLGWYLRDASAIVGFRIYRRSESEVAESAIAELPADDRSFADRGLDRWISYHYVVAALTEDGRELRSHEEVAKLSDLYMNLSQGHPNPFTGSTRLEFVLSEEACVRLSVYDLRGRRVITLIDEDRPVGQHTAIWDGRDFQGKPVSAGTYILRLEGGGEVQTKKLILVR